jgi:hypothetical protein
VGKMIAASPSVGYISEPFNLEHSRGIFNAATDRWYTAVSERNGGVYEEALRNAINFRYDPVASARNLKDPRGVAKLIFEYSRTCLYRWEGRRALLKDPLALFAAEWIAEKFDAQVVVLVRHPAAFVNSLIKARWRHPFSHFLEQPELMAEHLAPFRKEIESLVDGKNDILDEATLLWRATHHTIAKYRQAHPDWVFVRHEDLSRNPVAGFEPIFEHLGIEYTPHAKRTIELYTRQGNPIERTGEPMPPAVRLDSRRNADRWVYRLSHEQIERIRGRSADVWPDFYTSQEWGPRYREEEIACAAQAGTTGAKPLTLPPAAAIIRPQ